MRVADAVKFIYDNPATAPQDVASSLGISVRTLRSYVKLANDELEGVASVGLERGEGYRIAIENRESFMTWLDYARRDCVHLPQTPRERVDYLLNDLLSRSSWVTLDDLSEILFCSKSVLSTDLKQVELELSKFDLTLAKRPHYGIRVEGSEFARRLCLASAMLGSDEHASQSAESLFDAKDAALSLLLDSDDRHAVLKAISKHVDAAVNDHAYHINPVSYQNLLVHIAVALLRVRAGQYIPMETGQLNRIFASPEYLIAQEIADKIGDDLDIDLPQEEVAYLAIHLAGKQTLWAEEDEERPTVISDEAWELVNRIIDRVWHVFHIEFDGDIELRMNLARHLVPLLVRLRYHLAIDNPLLKEIKKRYLLAWSLAVEASEVIAAHIDALVSDAEVGYIALAFALALERKKGAPEKKNLLVVCASGAGSARLLEYRCRCEFGDYINRIDTCDVLSIDSVDFSKIDYVFTTVPLGRALPVPVREVTLFLDDVEAAEVRQFLNYGPAGNDLSKVFDPSLFFAHCSFDSKNEILKFLCDRICEQHQVDKGFYDLVLSREKAAATSFGNNVAMPHPLEPVSDDTIIAVALLNHPVKWDDSGTEVCAVFLICYARSGGRELDELFGALAELFMDEAAIASLVNEQTWHCLKQLIALPGVSTDR